MKPILTIDGTKAKALYPTASAEWIAAFELTWGKEFFSQDITDRVKTVKDACELTGRDPIEFMRFCSTLSPATASFEQQVVVIEALNEGWIGDYDNQNQEKWVIYWNMKKSASNPSGFGLGHVRFGYSGSFVGSRLSFKNQKLGYFFASQFADVAKPFFKP